MEILTNVVQIDFLVLEKVDQKKIALVPKGAYALEEPPRLVVLRYLDYGRVTPLAVQKIQAEKECMELSMKLQYTEGLENRAMRSKIKRLDKKISVLTEEINAVVVEQIREIMQRSEVLGEGPVIFIENDEKKFVPIPSGDALCTLLREVGDSLWPTVTVLVPN